MQAQGFELKQVVPLPMSDVVFDPSSVWKNNVHITQQNTLIIAPSGSGKTSLLAFLYGLRDNYSGNILYNGQDLSGFNLRKWAELRKKEIGVIFQDLRLIPHLDVKDNLLLKNRLTHFKSEAEIKIMLEKLGVDNKWNQSCGTLSFGQQQRVSIVRSLLQPFTFLLADEPFSHIDNNNIEKAKNLITEECHHQKAAFIMFSLGSDYQVHFDQTLHL